MAQISTTFRMTMENEEQADRSVEILREAIDESLEDSKIISQFSEFLENVEQCKKDATIELLGSFALSQYACEVIFPDWYKAIAKEYPESTFTAEVSQESYNDGSVCNYICNLKSKSLYIEKNNNYSGKVAVIYKFKLKVAEIKNYIFELNGIKEQQNHAVERKEIKGCIIENGVLKKYVGNNVKVIIPDGVISIGAGAFDNSFFGKSTIESIKIPNSVEVIGPEAFKDCKMLTAITIPTGVKNISPKAFVGCNKIKTISVSKDNKFYLSQNNCLIKTDSKTLILCVKGSDIPSDGSVEIIGSGAFSLWMPKTIKIPKYITKIMISALSSASLTSIEVDEGNSVYRSVGNCLIETKSKKLLLGCCNSVIPDDGSVAEICANAFASCKISNVNVPGSVKKIGVNAFKNCTKLESVTLCDGVENIEENAFRGCKNLSRITIGNGLKSIGNYALERCVSLSCITIPDSITLIGKYAFFSCENLERISLGKELTEIGENAFSYCSPNMNITFNGTKIQWDGIEKVLSWDSCLGNYTIHCTDGDKTKKE